MSSSNTADAAGCESLCSGVGFSGQGSVAWTFFTAAIGNNCQCWGTFDSPNGVFNADAISGRFVDEILVDGNCRNKCEFTTDSVFIDMLPSSGACRTGCDDGFHVGYTYVAVNMDCYCLEPTYGDPQWNAEFNTDLL